MELVVRVGWNWWLGLGGIGGWGWVELVVRLGGIGG